MVKKLKLLFIVYYLFYIYVMTKILQKYIKEIGITQLIEIYTKDRIENLFDSIYKIHNKIYYDKHKNIHLDKIFGVRSICMIMYILTNNSFVIFEKVFDFDTRAYAFRFYKIKFEDDKNIYIKIFEDSINLSEMSFREKYKQLFNNSPKILQISDLYVLLQKYNLKLYNIKLKIKYHSDYSSCNTDDAYIYQDNNISDAQNIFPKNTEHYIKKIYCITDRQYQASANVIIHNYNFKKRKFSGSEE
jgi:hypothetical protein